MAMALHEHTCCDKEKVKKGLWSEVEDELLSNYMMIIINNAQKCNTTTIWRAVPKHAGLQRCGKSCRLRWKNYLQPNLKRGRFSDQEAALVFQLQHHYGNKWAKIAKKLPGRTDNEIKNFFHTSLRNKFTSRSRHQSLPFFQHDHKQQQQHLPRPFPDNPESRTVVPIHHRTAPPAHSSSINHESSMQNDHDVRSTTDLHLHPPSPPDQSFTAAPRWINTSSQHDQQRFHNAHYTSATSLTTATWAGWMRSSSLSCNQGHDLQYTPSDLFVSPSQNQSQMVENSFFCCSSINNKKKISLAVTMPT